MIRFLSKASRSRTRGVALVRLDFNTEDEWRMHAALPTLRFLLRRAAKIVIVSHRGRPRGFERKWSLRKDAARLARHLRKRIQFIGHFRFPGIHRTIAESPRESVFLLENIRFLRGEETNDARLAKKLACLADFYVNDAFAVSHRDDASVDAITRYLPGYAGLELEKELAHLGRVMEHPRHPLVLLVGGGKAADKLGVIRYLKSKTSKILLGGAPANTLLFLKGMNVQQSIRDRNSKDLKKFRSVLRYRNVVLPIDFIVARRSFLDLGPKSVRLFESKIKNARTIIWNGPVGLIEEKRFEKATLALARAIVKNKKAFSVAGGGETVMFLKKYKLDKKFSFVSTGGGAMLDFLAGEKLPGIEALERSYQ